MKFRQIVVPLAMTFWAVTNSAQAPTWESETAAGMQAYQKRSYTEAEDLFKDAFLLAEQFGEFDPRLAAAMSNLAAVQQAEGKFAEAELLYNRALTICEKVYGPEQLEVATSLDNLANLLVQRVKYSDAEPLFERALTIREKALGPVHPDVAKVLSDLAGLKWVEGMYSESESLFNRALAIDQKALLTLA